MTEIDTKEVFLRKIYEEAKKTQPTQRKGQSIFNATELLYQVGRVVQMHNGIDCFYDDNKINQFLDLAYDTYVETINVTQWHKPQFLDENEED